MTFSRIGLGPLPASRHPLETVFWVFDGFAAVPSRGRCPLLASGVGLGGGYCTPPNRRDVSEANPLIVAPQQSYPQAWPVFLSSVCSLCSARAILIMRSLENRQIQLENRQIQLENRQIQLENRQKNLLTSRHENRQIQLENRQKNRSTTRREN